MTVTSFPNSSPTAASYCGENVKEIPPVVMQQPAKEHVNHPDHYQTSSVECIDALGAATEDLSGDEAFCTASAIKYLWRWKKKGTPIEDLRKAQWYIDRLINKLEGKNAK